MASPFQQYLKSKLSITFLNFHRICSNVYQYSIFAQINYIVNVGFVPFKVKLNEMSHSIAFKMSRVMRNPAFCICENKGADQLRGNPAADQRLVFATQIVQKLLPKSETSLNPCSVAEQPGLCQTWSETPKTCFPATRLKFEMGTILLRRMGKSTQLI